MNQPIFAFEWTDPESGFSGQLILSTHRSLRTPHSDEVLSADLLECFQEYLNIALLRYVNDLLITTCNLEECKKGTEELLEGL